MFKLSFQRMQKSTLFCFVLQSFLKFISLNLYSKVLKIFQCKKVL
jgi:hypothetical protein